MICPVLRSGRVCSDWPGAMICHRPTGSNGAPTLILEGENGANAAARLFQAILKELETVSLEKTITQTALWIMSNIQCDNYLQTLSRRLRNLGRIFKVVGRMRPRVDGGHRQHALVAAEHPKAATPTRWTI